MPIDSNAHETATADEVRLNARRYRQAFISSAALAVARGCSLLSMLVLVPVLFRYLDTERFGLWMAFTSVMASMSFADLGLGHGLMSAMAMASAADDKLRLQHLASSGLAAMLGIALPIAVIALLLGFFAPWNQWLGAENVPPSELRWSSGALLFGLAAGGIANMAGRIQSGLQTGYIASLWTAASAVGALVLIVAGTYVGVGMPWLVGALVGIPVLGGITNSIWYFAKHSPELRPRFRYADWHQVRYLLRLGSLFFILQVAAALTFATDNLIIAAMLGAQEVPGYAVPARLFACISPAIAILVQPLWPAYAEASARGNMPWVHRAFKRSLVLAFALSAVVSSTIYVLRDAIFPLWTQSSLAIDQRVVAMLAFWSVIDACSIAFATLLNGLNVVRFQVVIAIVLTVASFPVRYAALKTFGLWGLPLATSTVYVLVAVIPCAVVIPGLLRHSRPHAVKTVT